MTMNRYVFKVMITGNRVEYLAFNADTFKEAHQRACNFINYAYDMSEVIDFDWVTNLKGSIQHTIMHVKP
jgi:hypothetical protein